MSPAEALRMDGTGWAGDMAAIRAPEEPAGR